MGAVALFAGGNLLQSYAAATTLLLALVAAGGVIQYTSQELVDFRDIYREKDRLQKEKIRILTESLINLEKESLNNVSQSPTQSSEQLLNKEEHVTVIGNSQLSELSKS